ncbi:hypothetical protein [Amycolatopsis sp. NPDC004378]
MFGSWANTTRTLLYWCALIAAIITVTIVATPALQAGSLGLGGLWWLHRRRLRAAPNPAITV